MVISNWVSFQNFYFFLLLVCYVVLYFRQSNYMWKEKIEEKEKSERHKTDWDSTNCTMQWNHFLHKNFYILNFYTFNFLLIFNIFYLMVEIESGRKGGEWERENWGMGEREKPHGQGQSTILTSVSMWIPLISVKFESFSRELQLRIKPNTIRIDLREK